MTFLRATDADVVGGVGAVAAGAVRAQQVIPAVAIDQVGGFHVDGDVDRLVAVDALAGLGIEFDDADVAEVGAVGEPQLALGIEERGIDRVAVLDAVAGRDDADVVKFEVGRFRIERLGPHDLDVAGVAAGHAAAAHRIGDVVAVADLDDVGRDAAAGADRSRVPGPAVVGDQPAAARCRRCSICHRTEMTVEGSWMYGSPATAPRPEPDSAKARASNHCGMRIEFHSCSENES